MTRRFLLSLFSTMPLLGKMLSKAKNPSAISHAPDLNSPVITSFDPVDFPTHIVEVHKITVNDITKMYVTNSSGASKPVNVHLEEMKDNPGHYMCELSGEDLDGISVSSEKGAKRQ